MEQREQQFAEIEKMKTKLLLVLAVLAFSGLQTFGQGRIRFNNRVPGLLDAPVYLSDFQGAGALTGAMAQLYLIPINGPAVALAPATTFRTSSPAAMFYVNEPAEAVIVPNAPPGTTVNVQMRAWVGSPSYEAAEKAIGESNIIPVTVGGTTASGTIPDGLLINLQGFEIGVLSLPMGWFNSIRVEDEGIVLNVSTSNSNPTIIESSSNLENWQPIFTNPPIRTDFTVPLSGTNRNSQFYRMRLQFDLR
jgi:hypothetical protein